MIREPNAELGGYAWLPRLLDKARLTLAGNAGDLLYGCPVDHTCLARLGVTPELVLDLVARHDDDAVVLAALREHGIPSPDEASFDAQSVEDSLQDGGPYLRVRRRDALPEVDGARVFAGDEHGSEATVELIDAPPGVRQAPHVHPYAEVVVVHGGQATFHLGEVMSRIVRADEVVRIPAGTTHWWVSSGDMALRAVAAHSA